MSIPSLSRVLKKGNKTKGKDIIISAGDSIVGSDNLKLKGKNIKHKSKKDNILECGGEHVFICGKNCDQNISGEHIYNCGKNCIQNIQGDHNSTIVGEKNTTAAKLKFGIASVQGKEVASVNRMTLDSQGLNVEAFTQLSSGFASNYEFFPQPTDIRSFSSLSLINVTTNTGGLNIANGQGVLFDNGTGVGGQSVVISNTSSTLSIQVYFTTKNGPYAWLVIDPLYTQQYVYVDVYNGVKKWTALQPSKVFVQPELD
jgi:hypothetical protein